jgi:hypothetical protein
MVSHSKQLHGRKRVIAPINRRSVLNLRTRSWPIWNTPPARLRVLRQQEVSEANAAARARGSFGGRPRFGSPEYRVLQQAGQRLSVWRPSERSGFTRASSLL